LLRVVPTMQVLPLRGMGPTAPPAYRRPARAGPARGWTPDHPGGRSRPGPGPGAGWPEA